MFKLRSDSLRKCACALALTTGLGFASQAQAALILTVNSYTTDQISLSISGTFDASAIGDSKEYLAIKNNWSNNVGVHTEWFNVAPTLVSNSITFNGRSAGVNIQNGASTWMDNVFWSDPFGSITAGTTVAGTLVLSGAGAFNVADAKSLELVSGFSRPAGHDDWARLEAKSGSTAIPEPTSIALLGLGLLGVAAARRKKSA